MLPLSVTIDDSIKTVWPETRLACLVYSLTVSPGNAELWEEYARRLAQPLQQELATTELADMPGIRDARAAYKAFGIDPGRHRVSSEALYRRIRQGKDLYQINSLVDANNVASLETGFSLGSYDTARIGREIVFRLGRKGETYAGIGKSAIALENMPLLADADGPFGSPTSDSTRAMIGPGTTEGLTVIYSFSGPTPLQAALELTGELLTRYAGANGLSAFLA